jgi:hypothetical protein
LPRRSAPRNDGENERKHELSSYEGRHAAAGGKLALTAKNAERRYRLVSSGSAAGRLGNKENSSSRLFPRGKIFRFARKDGKVVGCKGHGHGRFGPSPA